VVVDQDFERNVYDGKEYITFATLPGMKERTITVFGTSKDLGLTGFRVGYMVAPPQIIQILKPATFNYMGPTTTFSQYGVAAGYLDTSYVDEWMKIFMGRREKGYKILNEIPGLECPKNDAGFFFWADCSKLGDDLKIVEHLINDAQVGVGPGSWFGNRGTGYLRIMYGRVPTEDLYDEALERMYNSLIKLSR
jgi:aspartate/methionine/tyrosine aminotransferase